MTNINNELAIENNLNTEDIVLISYFEFVNKMKGCNNEFVIGYNEIINDLPILFNSTERSNVAKLRKMLNKEGVKVFITRSISQQGRGLGAKVLFKINRDKVEELNVKGIVNFKRG